MTAGQCRGRAGSTGAGASPGLSRVPSPTLPRHALPSPLDAAPLWRRGGQRSHPPGARARVPTRCRGPGVGTPPDATGPRPPRCSHTARRDAFCSSVRHGPAGACARARSCPWLGAGARATPAVRWWRHRLPHRSHCCPPPLPPPPRGAQAGRPRFLFRTSASPLQNAIFTTIDVFPLTKPPHVHSLQKCAGWDPSPGALGLSLPLNDWYAENSGRSPRPPDGPHGAAGSTGSTRPTWGQRTEAAVAAALGPAARRRGPPDAMPVPGRSGLQAQLGGPPHPVMFQTPG